MEKRIDIPQRLKAWRTRERLTQKQAAEKLEIPLGTYLTYESGRRVKRLSKLTYEELVKRTARR